MNSVRMVINVPEVQDNNHNMQLAGQLAKCEAERIKLIEEKNEIMKDFNTRMKVHLEEIRLLKEVNEKLQTDLDELRDLCCYLDDDRQRCRRLAREWQNFGRYVSSKLQSKESSYQAEINLVNLKQETIIAENVNLKRLCQDLEKRSTGYNEPREYVCIRCSQKILLESKHHHGVISPTDIFIDHTAPDIHHSTRREKSLTEEDSPVFSPYGNVSGKDSFENTVEVNGRKKKVSFVEPDEISESDDDKPKHVPINAESNALKENICRGILRNGVKKSHSNSLGSSSSAESDSSVNNINRAMRVLEIHTKLEEKRQDRQLEPLKDKEVAVLKEMCNVVWRKLSSDDPSNNVAEYQAPTDDVIYEDLL